MARAAAWQYVTVSFPLSNPALLNIASISSAVRNYLTSSILYPVIHILYNYPMNFNTLFLILITALGINVQAQERTVVATVDSSPIYLGEIGGSNDRQEGEIKFVDPEATPGGTDIESRILLLRKRIKDELLRREIDKRAIVPSDDLVLREVNAYADRQWRLLFPNPEKRKEVLSKMQLTGLKILEGLNIWRHDKEKGNEFAKNELEPLGMNEQAWSFYTENAQDPEILGKLKKWEEINTMTQDEIKEFLFLTTNEDHRENIKFILARDMLKRSVAPEVTVSPEETQRLHELINNTAWIDIIIIPEGGEELTKLSGAPKKERNSLLSDEVKSNKIRLPRSDTKDAERNISSLKEFMILATYTESLEPGTLSSVVEWSQHAGGFSTFVIYIVDRNSNSEIIGIKEPRKAELTEVLKKFKRDREFLKWINREMPQRTKILLPEYKEALQH